MASVYKWRLTGNTYAYITDKYNIDPVITDGYTVNDDAAIASYVKKYSETEYKNRYNFMVGKIAENPLYSGITMLSYKYYYDINPGVCGFPQQEIIPHGPTGPQGPQGPQGIQGQKGEDGRGIAEITTSDITTNGTSNNQCGKRVSIVLTDGTTYSFDILNGINGTTPPIGNIVSGIVPQVAISASSIAISEVRTQFLDIINNTNSEIDNLREILAGQASGITKIQVYASNNQGIVEGLLTDVGELSGTASQIYVGINAVSGQCELAMISINELSGTATVYDHEIDTLSGYMGTMMYTLSNVSGTVSAYTELYSALGNSYNRTVALLSGDIDPDSGDPIEVEMSTIHQTSNEISALVTSGDGSLSAGLILSINDNESTAKINADQIILEGNLIAEAITGTSIILASGNTAGSYFDGDGSGYLAGGSIEWTDDGSMSIHNNAYIHDVSIENAAISAVTIDAATINEATISAADIENSYLNNVVIEGALVTPWVSQSSQIGGWPRSINYAYRTAANRTTTLGDDNNSQHENILTWNYKDAGRTINIGNFGNEVSQSWGTLTIIHPDDSSAMFYEDGVVKDYINLSRELVTLIGLGFRNDDDETGTFLGYVVLNRIDVQTENVYGRKTKDLFHLLMRPNGGVFTKTFDGSALTVRYDSTSNLYRITLPAKWNGKLEDNNGVMRIAPFATGIGLDENGVPIIANIADISKNDVPDSTYVISVSLSANGVKGEYQGMGGFTLRACNVFDFSSVVPSEGGGYEEEIWE